MRYERLISCIAFIGLFSGVAVTTYLSYSETSYFNIHPFLLPIFFALSLLLLLVILKMSVPLSVRVKLSMIGAYTFLGNMIHVALLFPGLTGDLAYHLGVERTWDIFGTHYMLLWPLDTYVSQIQGVLNRLYIFQRGTAQYGLVVTLSKMLGVDVFWINALLIGVLWSTFIPIIAFKASKTADASDRTGLLAGLLTANVPVLVLYSWKSAGNVFGFFFFFLGIYFMLKFISGNSGRKGIFLILLTSAAAMLSHPMTGILSLVLIPLAFGLRRYYPRKTRSSTTTLALLCVCFLIVAFSLPIASILLQVVYPTHSELSLQRIFSLDVYHLVFTEFADYGTVAVLTYGGALILSIIGMVAFRGDENEEAPRLFLIVVFAALFLQHRIFYYFIEDPLFGTHRLYALLPIVTMPFAAMVIDRLAQNQGFPKASAGHPDPSPGSKFRVSFTTRETLAILFLGIALSGLLVQGHISSLEADAVDREPFGIVSPYSTEVVALIHEEFLRNRARYIVVSDMVTEYAGLMFRGRSNIDELYLETQLNRQFYTQTLEKRSSEPLIEASSVNNASFVYLTVARYSIRMYLGPLVSYEDVTASLGLTLENVAQVGEGEREVTVFRLMVARKPYSGIGPAVDVLADSVQSQLNTTYSYVTLDNVEYALSLSGATTYNITDWPNYWSYESISPAPNSILVNADAWINFTGSVDSNYTVRWKASDLYPNVVWKDDSFMQGWIFTGRTTLSSYSFTSDGDVANLSLSGKVNDWANYQKALPSLTGSTRFMIRLKGGSNSKFLVQIWEDIGMGWEGRAFSTPTWLKPSADYTTYVYPMTGNATLTLMWLSVMTTDGAPATIYFDYIMIIG